MWMNQFRPTRIPKPQRGPTSTTELTLSNALVRFMTCSDAKFGIVATNMIFTLDGQRIKSRAEIDRITATAGRLATD
jgi:hypothetical protein